MRRHTSVHSSERPYNCSSCHMNFKHKDSLNIHNKTRSHQAQNGFLQVKEAIKNPVEKCLPQKEFSMEVPEVQMKKEFLMEVPEVQLKMERDVSHSESKFLLDSVVDIEESLINSIEVKNEPEPKSLHSAGKIDRRDLESERRKVGKVEPDLLSLDNDNLPFLILQEFARFPHQSETNAKKRRRRTQLNAHYSCPFSPFCLFALNRKSDTSLKELD